MIMKEISVLNTNVLIIAHRGYSSEYPESTTLAYTKSMEIDIDFIEADIQLTKDGHFVIFHDYDLSRLTNSRGYICDYYLQDLKKLNIISNNKYGFQTIPSLEEVINLVKNSFVRICLELKDIPKRRIRNYEDIIVPFLIKNSVINRVVFNLPNTPESDDFTIACSEKYPFIPIAYDFSIDESKTNEIDAFIRKCLKYGIRIVEYEYRFLSKNVIRKLKSNGISVWTWTINDENEMINAINMGVDGILTDDPYKLARIIGRI